MLMSNPAKAMDADKEESDITFGGRLSISTIQLQSFKRLIILSTRRVSLPDTTMVFR